ncbi:MAG: TIGR03087 family PEP-CTERM/XrtA system glycosyltransferase [Planctomycetota bacterium]
MPVRILYICHRVPYPPDKGDKIRSFHVLRGLCRRHEVHLVALADRAEDLAARLPLQEMCASVHLRRLRPLVAKVRSLTALPSGRSMSVRYFASRGLATDVRSLLTGGPFDVAVAYSSTMAPYLRLVRGPTAVDLVDVDSEKFRQYGASHHSLVWPLHALEGRRLRSFEKRTVESVPLSIVCTEEEAAVLSSFAEPLRLEVVPNGVDLERFSFAHPLPESPSAAFIGAMDYRANADGAVWFVHEVLPWIRRDLPDFVFRIVGREPTAAVRALAVLPGVQVTGAVPDVLPYLRCSSLTVAPLKVARGIQNKVLESLAAGTPSVATSEAARGIGARSGLHLIVADEPEEMARGVIGLLREPARARAMAAEARCFVEARYAWSRSQEKLERILEEVSKTGLERMCRERVRGE